jgi:hypothetical protein
MVFSTAFYYLRLFFLVLISILYLYFFYYYLLLSAFGLLLFLLMFRIISWIDRSWLGGLVSLIIPGLVVLLVYFSFFMPTVFAEGVEGSQYYTNEQSSLSPILFWILKLLYRAPRGCIYLLILRRGVPILALLLIYTSVFISILIVLYLICTCRMLWIIMV